MEVGPFRLVRNLLRTAPRELWLVYLLKVLDSYGYFALSEVFTLLLTDEFGVDDVTAGAYYGAWGTAITLYGIFTGCLIDVMGVRTSLVASYALQTASRVVLVGTRSRALALTMLFLVQPLGSSWGAPVLTIAIKRLTANADRTVSFGIFYAMMNVAALVSGIAIDALRLGLPGGLSPGDPTSVLASPIRVVVASTVISSIVAVAVSSRFRELPPHGGGRGEHEHPVVSSFASPASYVLATYYRPAAALMRSRRFWQFLAMALFTLNLKQIFRHMDATFPKYALRAFGCDAPFGSIYAINPALIVLGVPVVAALTPNVRHFDMIFRGSWITALSPFTLALSQTYAGACAFVVLLSIGEAIWSPRWYDFTMACAPVGKEGVFGALALMPLFVAKLPVGVLGGYLLHTYCPGREGGDCPAGGGSDDTGGGAAAGRLACDGRAMWGTIGLITLTSPVLIAIFHPLLRGAEDTDSARGGGGSSYAYEELDAPVVVAEMVEMTPERGEIEMRRGCGAVEDDDDAAEIELIAPEGTLVSDQGRE